jgi:hypothetical protein
MTRLIPYTLPVIVGALAALIAATVDLVHVRYLVATLAAMFLACVALSLGSSQRLSYFFLAGFALGIPFNLDMNFYYSKTHIGGASGVDISLCFVCAAILYFVLFYENASVTNRFPFTSNRTLVSGQVIFMMAGVLSLINAYDAILVFCELIRLVVLFSFFYLVMNLRDERRLRVLVFFLSVGLLSQSVLAVYQYVTGSTLGLKIFGEQPLIEQYLGAMISRATGTIGHPNILAYYFEILIPFVFAMYLVEERSSLRLWYLVVAGVSLGGMYVTMSRAGWLTIPLSIPLVFFMLSNGRLISRRTVAQILVGVLCVGVFLSMYYPRIERRYLHDDYGAAAARMPLNWAALSVIGQFPVAGVGLNNLGEVFLTYDTTGGAVKLYGLLGSTTHVVHNLFLAVWADVGIVGLLAFLWIFFSTFLVAGRLLSKVPRWQKGVLIGVMAGIMAHLIHGLFDPGFRYALNMSYLMYTLIGLVGAISLLHRKERAGSFAGFADLNGQPGSSDKF